MYRKNVLIIDQQFLTCICYMPSHVRKLQPKFVCKKNHAVVTEKLKKL